MNETTTRWRWRISGTRLGDVSQDAVANLADFLNPIRTGGKLMFQVFLLTAFVVVAAYEEWPTKSTDRARRNMEQIPSDWSPSGRGVGGRLDAIQAGLDADPDNPELLELARGYWAERQYADAELVVVPRPRSSGSGSGSGDTERIARAYDNMKIRLAQTKYNDVRPGPSAYYMPADAGVLSETVKRLNEENTPFLIRGGGHSAEANTLPRTDRTAVIDMAKFTSLRVSDSVSTGRDGVRYREVSFGTGLRLATIYVYLARQGLAFVSGSCPTNGSGGYFLGGGAGMAMRKFGWASDQMVRAKVLLSDGSYAVADSDDGKAVPGQPVKPSELLWALRGGGAGTAIVYEYTLKVYEAPRTVSRCIMTFETSTKEAYTTFVSAWSDDWKIYDVDTAYPYVRIYSTNTESDIVMDGWDMTPEALSRTMADGMAAAAGIRKGGEVSNCTSFDYPGFLRETFDGYYSRYPEMRAGLGWNNYTTPGLLAMDYVGFGYAGADIPVAPPLSPYAPFVATAPTVNGPKSGTSQGILSSKPWSEETAAELWDVALSTGVRFYSYVLGGRLGGRLVDGVGSAFDALSHGVFLTVTSVPPTDLDANRAASAVARVLDTRTVSKQPSRHYNFLNCYDKSEEELFRLYYGDDASERLVDIKKRADPESRLKTWCDV